MNLSVFKRLVVATAVSAVVGMPASGLSAAPAEPLRSPAMHEKGSTGDRFGGTSAWVEDEVLVDFAAGDAERRLDQVEGVEGAEVAGGIKGTDLKVVDLPGDVSVEEALGAFSSDPAVKSVEPNLYLFPSQTIPDDPRFDDLWGLHNTGQDHRIADPPPPEASGKVDADIDAPEAWDTQQGTPGSIIAVVDTGVDIDHPDLDGSLWENPGEIPDNGLDDDDNGFVDDIHGWDFGLNDASLLDPDDIAGFDHGTHVAGTIAAEMDNATGVAGICPGCRIMVVKFMKPLDTDGDGEKDTMGGTLGDELEALAYARRKNADVINASFSTSFFSLRERRAYARLHKAGVLVVAAAGNSNLDNDMFLQTAIGGSAFFSPEYPASFNIPSVMSVAASNHDDRYGFFTGCAMDIATWQCAFTNWGHDAVDIAAPGVDVMSTVPDGYSTFDGTSMAAPHIAGIAGLLKSEHPGYTPMDLKNAIMNSADKPDSLKKLNAFPGGAVNGKFTLTNGRGNAAEALTASTENATPESNGNVAGSKRLEKSLNGRVIWPGDINDVFHKWLKKDRTYRAVLDGPNNKDFDLLVWKPGTVEIWQYEFGCDLGVKGPCKLLRYADTPNEADEKVQFTTKKSGIYFIHVSAWLRNSGNFHLRIKRV